MRQLLSINHQTTTQSTESRNWWKRLRSSTAIGWMQCSDQAMTRSSLKTLIHSLRIRTRLRPGSATFTESGGSKKRTKQKARSWKGSVSDAQFIQNCKERLMTASHDSWTFTHSMNITCKEAIGSKRLTTTSFRFWTRKSRTTRLRHLDGSCNRYSQTLSKWSWPSWPVTKIPIRPNTLYLQRILWWPKSGPNRSTYH